MQIIDRKADIQVAGQRDGQEGTQTDLETDR